MPDEVTTLETPDILIERILDTVPQEGLAILVHLADKGRLNESFLIKVIERMPGSRHWLLNVCCILQFRYRPSRYSYKIYLALGLKLNHALRTEANDNHPKGDKPVDSWVLGYECEVFLSALEKMMRDMAGVGEQLQAVLLHGLLVMTMETPHRNAAVDVRLHDLSVPYCDK